MSNVGKRVRAKCQGETDAMREGTIIQDDDGICVIEWDDPRSVKGATLSSHIHGLIEAYTLHEREVKPHLTVIVGGK